MAKRSPPPSLPMPISEGVHLNIPPNVYFEAHAIGSSDLKTLYWQPESWWYSSWANARRRTRLKSSARKSHFELGDALHTLVLEGEEVYRRRFVLEPDEDAGHWIRSPQELKRELREMGVDVAGAYGPALEKLARRAGLANRYWETAWASYEAAQRAGRPSLTEDQDMRVRATARLITTHPELGPALYGPGGLSEVAVFWRRESDPDTLMRAKFDRIRVGRILDVKTLSNWRGKDRDGAIRDTIEQNEYGIQRRLYQGEAFPELVRFVREGKVYFWADDGEPARPHKEDRELLERIAEKPTVWAWVFAQLRQDAAGQERAPGVAARWVKAEGRMWTEAGEKIEEALENFRRLRAEFGTGREWVFVDETKELIDSDIRSRRKEELK